MAASAHKQQLLLQAMVPEEEPDLGRTGAPPPPDSDGGKGTAGASLPLQSLSVRDIICRIPKAELHVHLEGTLEPSHMLALATRNGIELPYSTVEEIQAAYKFKDLQSFLDIYYQGAKVLLTAMDFYELAFAYLERAHRDGVRHVEAFFDPQTHTQRGVPFGVFITAFHEAFSEARRRWGLSFHLIMCFLRHLDEEEHLKTLEQALPYRELIAAVGLDSSEVGHPPSKMEKVFERARAAGFLAVAHAGEEGPPENISDSLDLLKVRRIDHGVQCLQDSDLVERLVREGVPLTVCPLSNIKLRVFRSMKEHTIKSMLEKDIVVTVNSDDPAYFGGYIADNFEAIHTELELSLDDIFQLATNSIVASFLPQSAKEELVDSIETLRMSLNAAAAADEGQRALPLTDEI
eukprot:TRINITY_DN16552_c0_g1_i2.p1 TRINITY_DN16552_c0_g1~~TRINITY_DN16552_c0_g1_i2.p1  ORF type:complete len:412 (-),score=119.69 TRINITY_DN16552_c0_g1_i2:237-1451(-)